MNPPTQRKTQLPSQEQQPPMNYIKTTPPHIPKTNKLNIIKKKKKKNQKNINIKNILNNWLFSHRIPPHIEKRKFGSEL
ncbi:hypothetical protein J4V49_25720 [Escherichia coli]